MHKTSTKIKNYFVNFIFAQLIVTLISLPILINWGLPISLMSAIGNFLFSPFITLFLILSSFMFFSELIGIPNSWLGIILNRLTNLLELLLKFGQKNWLLSLPLPKYKLILLIIPLIVIFIISSKKIKFSNLRMTSLLIALILCIGCLQIYCSFKTNNNCNLEKLNIIKNDDGSIDIVDAGLFNRQGSVDNYINFEILPFISKNYGNPSIKNLTLLKPSIRSFNAAMELHKRFHIKQIKINFKNIKLSKYGWRTFYKLKDIIIKEHGLITKIKK